MANVTRIKAKDDASKKAEPKEKVVTEPEEAPARKVKVKAKGSDNKKVIKSQLERQAERDLENRQKDRAEKKAIREAYQTKRAEIKSQLKKTKKTAPKAEKKALKKKVKSELRELKHEQQDKYPGYFRGAFREIRQVRWPNRKETWKLTFAVIGYVLLAMIGLAALDAILKLLFNTIIGGNM